jgi:ATP-dependent DNA helicase DinG
MFTNKFVVIDLETTGNLPKKGDKIIQFAAVVIENGIITEKFSSLINPQKSIPVFIEELTGIHDDMVKDAPVFSEIGAKVMELLDGAYFVAHNVLFDLSFLQEELLQAGFEGFYGSVLDTVEMARILYPTADGYKLSDLAEREQLAHDRPHQADSDAEVTAELFLIFLRKLAQLPTITLQQLQPLSGGLKSDLQQLLDELLIVMNQTHQKLHDSLEIHKGIAMKRLTELQDDSPSKSALEYPGDDDKKINLIRRAFEEYENRTGQFTMMDTVYTAFNQERHAIIEAGTGVGKSLGYLIPAAYFSKQTNSPVIISTHTIQLQEQLLYKEIPKLRGILPFVIKTVLLKGRSHYICLEKFRQSLFDENDNYDTTLSKMQILVWLTETETGDKDELNLSSGGLIYWNKIKNDGVVYSQNHGEQERDFYQKAKVDAKTANIIITNHSLLLNDLRDKSSALPHYDFAIIDEGHHLEKAAVHFFGTTLDYLSTRMLIGQFGQYEQKQLFYELEEILKDKQAAGAGDTRHLFKLDQLVVDLNYEMDEFFKLLALFAKRKLANKTGFFRSKVRFSPLDNSKESRAVLHSAERFSFLIKDLQTVINERLKWVQQLNYKLTVYQESKLEELVVFLNEITELRNTLKTCFINESKDVKWVEIDLRSPQNVTTFIAQPASVGERLKEKLFSSKKAIVITSATLTVNKSFHYMKKELGLDGASTTELVVPSPFAYKDQVQMFVPEDLPEINSVSLDEYVISITEHIISIAEATKGRMLLLFTAYDMLKKTYELIKESGFLDEYVLIAQGITSGSRTRLTRNFQRYEKAILLGTSSFWEGVDIPGEDLSCLVIVRLPFSPPDEPLTEAKCQLIEKRGGNPFSEYSLPEAVLRFKQGFGRLIRTQNDKGVVVVFDKRIVTTNYGKYFLASVPPVTIKRGPLNELIESIQTWL